MEDGEDGKQAEEGVVEEIFLAHNGSVMLEDPHLRHLRMPHIQALPRPCRPVYYDCCHFEERKKKVDFTDKDVVRHGLVTKLVRAYDARERRNKGE